MAFDNLPAPASRTDAETFEALAQDVGHGCRLLRTLASAALFLLVPFAAHAGTVGAQLAIGATVPLVASIEVHHQARGLTISQADVARGFVDVPAGSRFSVATTSRDGYVVDLVPTLPIFTAVEVRSAVASAALGAEGGTLIARGRPRRDANAELSYRFVLAPAVTAGDYPFPLHMAVRPL